MSSDFASPGDIITALAGAGNGPGCRQFGIKGSITTVASFYYSSWTATGTGGTGVAPTSWATCNANLAGSWAPNLVDENAGTTNRLLYTSFTFPNATDFLLCDRIGHMGGMSGVVTTAQTTGASLATAAASGRCQANGSDVMWFLEWYVATGATPVTATISYTNQAGTPGQSTTVALPASVPAGRMYPINVLATGDTSIKSVDSVTITTTGTAGNFGVTAVKVLDTMSTSVANAVVNQDWAACGLPLIAPQVCFFGMQWATTTTLGQVGYQIVVGTH